MKALVLYITALLTVALLMSEVSLAWLALAVVDLTLISWLHNNITLYELVKYSGYKHWYKLLNN